LPAALPDLPLVLLADRDVLAARAAALGLELPLPEWAPGRPA
ncbi:MAG TPA: 4-hydroxythreonine-4-phosphate dehydrogenase PdxA, partial [Alcanivorax sp.]|nr:4-hydroxythreonine-4-phosphate dehydrogenase PdxA [Alcanivorax sp.]